jgi:hypothetical protein
MKKIRLKPAKTGQKVKTLGRVSKPQLIGGLVTTLIIASLGIYTLLSSFAATTPPTIAITVKDVAGNPIPTGEAQVSLAGSSSSSTPCANMDGSADSQGVINFNSCPLFDIFTVNSITFKNGWYELASSSQLRLGYTVAATSGSTTDYSITFQLKDTDQDGIPDKTDACASNAAPGTSNGCPVAPAAPPAPKPPAASGTTKKATTKAAPSAPPVVVATTGDTTPPVSPANFTAELDDDTVFLSWDEASDNTAVTAYSLERSTDQENWSSLAEDIPDTFYTDSDLATGEHYYYRLRAADAAGNLSEAVYADTAGPAVSKKSTAPKTTAPATKKSSAKVVSIMGGILLLLVAFFAAAWLLLRRSRGSGSSDPYDVPGVEMMTAPPTNPQYVPQVNAAHTSVSLKDMVMDNINHPQANGVAQIPGQVQQPQQPGQPLPQQPQPQYPQPQQQYPPQIPLPPPPDQPRQQ